MPEINFWYCSDSTAHNETTGQQGVAEVLQAFFIDKLTVRDVAWNGRSSKDYYEGFDSGGSTRRIWIDEVRDLIQSGDVVSQQWGHNDKYGNGSNETEEGTAPNYTGSFRTYHELYISETLARGGIPHIITPVSRMQYTGDPGQGGPGDLNDTHANYDEAARKIAQDNNVELLDLEALSFAQFNALNESQVEDLFGITGDDTHFGQGKAFRIAYMLIDRILNSNSVLRDYVKPEYANFTWEIATEAEVAAGTDSIPDSL